MLLAETDEGYHNLIKLVSSGYTEGFYYKPRIDKDAAGAARRRAHRPEQLPQGRGRRAASAPSRRRRRVAAAATYRDILGAGNFFLEMQYQGIEEQRIVNTGLLPIARDLGLPLVVHQRRALPAATRDHKPHDILLCIGTGKTVNDAKRLRYHGDQFFLKTAEEMAAGLRRLSRRRWPTRCASPSGATSILSGDENHLPNFDVPAGLHARRLLRARRPRGVRAAAAAAAAARRRRARCATRIDEYERAARVRDRR